MKKITLFLVSIIALASIASAQTPVNGTEFTSNPERFKGMTTTIAGVNLRPKQAVTAIAVGAPSVVTVGKGSTANVVASCKVIRGYKSIDVDFPTSPTFAKCFYILESQFNNLPITQDVIKAQITFKGEEKLGYIITLFKL